jgi:hypothetical protein
MHKHRSRVIFAGAVLALCLGLHAPALADEPYYTDWTEYYYNAGVDAHFYYSPRSVYRIDNFRQVEWTDSKDKGAEKITFIVHIDCTQHTIQSRMAKRYRSSDNAYIGPVMLADKAPVEAVTPNSMADRLFRAVC